MERSGTTSYKPAQPKASARPRRAQLTRYDLVWALCSALRICTVSCLLGCCTAFSDLCAELRPLSAKSGVLNVERPNESCAGQQGEGLAPALTPSNANRTRSQAVTAPFCSAHFAEPLLYRTS